MFFQALIGGVLNPVSAYEKVISETLRTTGDYFRFYMTSGDCDASYENLKMFLLKTNCLAEQNRNMVLLILVFSYCFIVLILLIAADNVFNTVFTNVCSSV